jgi:hypothetical protein
MKNKNIAKRQTTRPGKPDTRGTVEKVTKPDGRQTVAKRDLGTRDREAISPATVAPLERKPEQPSFKPLTKEELGVIRSKRAPKGRKGPQPGDTLVIADDVMVVEDERVYEGRDALAPKWTLERVGKRRLSDIERAAVLKAGTRVTFERRGTIFSRQHSKKGSDGTRQIVRGEDGKPELIHVSEDIVRIEVPDGEPMVACGDRGMWKKADEGMREDAAKDASQG